MPTRSRSRSADSDHGTAPYASYPNQIQAHYRGRNRQLRDLSDWLHSPDTQLQATGDTTHINYSARLSEYLGQLVEGLRSQVDWAEGLLKQWNNVFFPDRNDFDHEEPTGYRLAEREDRNEARAIFRNAWGSAHYASPTAGPSTPRRSCD
ncbi:hypothetical protein B0H14DRAFT_3137439 [Mycena olivaceomarginata]|nr:hypothetical protein B0H14DRAFT_3137439 [Mycena olivaceomarginata]